MFLQKAENGMVSVPCDFEGFVNIEILEKKDNSIIVRIIKPEILFEKEQATPKKRGRKKKKRKSKQNKKKNEDEDTKQYDEKAVKELIKNNYGIMTFEELAEETGKTVKEIKDLANEMLIKGEIENNIDEAFIFKLYNEEGISNAKEIRQYIENRYVKVYIDALKIMEMIRHAISVRHALHCRECPELKKRGRGMWCPVRKYKVKPEQFICLEKVEELVGG